ncbi:MAG: VPLPA-CTERM sorting domain-containing protein [Gemmobacter sp.]
MRKLAIVAVMGCASVPAQASTVNYVLDFDGGSVCTSAGLPSFPDGTLGTCVAGRTNVGLTYGDQPGVDVEWRASGNLATQSRFSIAASPFGGIYEDGFINTPGNLFPGFITFRALDGATVGLQGFVARSSNFVTVLGNNAMNYLITDLAVGGFGSVAGVVASTTIQNDRRVIDLGNLTSSVGIEFRFGVDGSVRGWGVDDIAYSVTAKASPPPPPTGVVPLPAAGWLMIGGIGALAALRRRRRG